MLRVFSINFMQIYEKVSAVSLDSLFQSLTTLWKCFPYIQWEFSVLQFVIVVSWSFALHFWEEPVFVFCRTTHQAVEVAISSPQRLSQGKQTLRFFTCFSPWMLFKYKCLKCLFPCESGKGQKSRGVSQAFPCKSYRTILLTGYYHWCCTPTYTEDVFPHMILLFDHCQPPSQAAEIVQHY